MLQTMDNYWREHLSALDHLRQGIHLRGYAQKNPKQEYKREAFDLFSMMLDSVRNEVTRILMTVQIRTQDDGEGVGDDEPVAEPAGRGAGPAPGAAPVNLVNVRYQHADYEEALAEANAEDDARKPQPFVRRGEKVGRNDPCPCGSGKKYKQCHGRLA
jgi:preprotein translocase subunit SecA